LYWNTRKASKLATLECKKNDVQAPTPGVFCEKSSQSVENERPALQKARKSSEDAENNIDNAEATRI
jgi:hypothetical protein